MYCSTSIRRFFVITLLAGSGIWLSNCTAESESKDNTEKDSSTAIPVESAQVQQGDISAYYKSTATLEAEDEALVVSKVGGIVEEIYVEEGDIVEPGQKLAELEDEQLEIELNQAEANFKKLKNDFERNQELYQKNLISAEQYENKKFEFESQKAAYELAKLRVKHSTIRAPIEGVISERFIKKGNMMGTNEQTFKITDFDPLLAVLHVPEHEMNKLKKDQTTLLNVDALPGETFHGEILRISPVVDPSTGTFKVTVAIKDESRRLKPGMFGRIQIVYDVHANTRIIPKNAVISEDNTNSVFVIEDKMAFKRPIEIGYSNGSRQEVLNGLEVGQQVVTIGQSSLQDSTMVDVITYD